MNQLKKILLGLAVTVTLVLVGANTASAQCATVPTNTSPTVRGEGTVEAVGNITFPTCTPISAVSNITVAFTPSATKITPGAGTSPGGVTFCTITAPDTKSTFACPSLNSWTTAGCALSNGAVTVGCPAGTAVPVAFAAAPTATITGNTLNFNFTPTAVAQNFSIFGIRISAASTALPSGGVVSAAVVRGGGGFTAASTTLQMAFVINLMGAGSGFTNATVTTIPACGPVKTPLGTPAIFAGNPDLGLASSLKVTLVEGFLGAFVTAATSDNGVPGLQGIRFRINLTGVPSGIVAYAPEIVSPATPAAQAASTGSVLIGAGAGGTTVTLVGPTVGADGSGAAPLVAPVVTAAATQFDLITPVGGTISITYEVTTNALLTGIETVTIIIPLTGTATTGSGSISGSVGPAPVGAPGTQNPSLPQFAGAKTSVVANVIVCSTYLLFPYMVNTGDGSYDTGISISNTTADPSVIGSTGQTGDVTMYFFPSDTTGAPLAPFSQLLKAGVQPGGTATFVLSSLKKTFQGYMIAVCGFTLGHGFAFIDNPIATAAQNGFAEGYLALSINNPRLGSLIPIETAGH